MTMLAALAFAAAAFAQPAAPADVPEDIAKLALEWGLCRGRVVFELTPTAQTPEQVGRAVSTRCESHAARLSDAGVAHFGPDWRAEVETLRTRAEAMAAQDVRDQRAGRDSSNPTTAWGQCLGRHVARVNAAPDREEAIDGAFAACGAEEEAARRFIAASGSPEEADARIALLRRMTRERVFVPGGPAPR
jgi:hypothetical protein